MPYRDPGGEKLWLRRNGNIRLELQAGRVLDPNLDKVVDVGLPFGPKPRLVFYHLNAEAMRTQSPVVALEDSLTAFVKRTLKLDVGGRTIRSVKDQLTRLSAADFRFYAKFQDHAMTVKGTVIEGARPLGFKGRAPARPLALGRAVLAVLLSEPARPCCAAQRECRRQAVTQRHGARHLHLARSATAPREPVQARACAVGLALRAVRPWL